MTLLASLPSDDDTSNPDLRAAWLLRNVGGISLGVRIEEDLAAIAAEMKIDRAGLIRLAVREWLEARQNLPAKPTGVE